MTEKIYFNSLFCKKSKYGIKLTGKAEDVIKAIQQHANEKGYINLELLEYKEPKQNGITHYITVDTWTPKPKDEPAAINYGAPKDTDFGQDEKLSKDDLPF